MANWEHRLREMFNNQVSQFKKYIDKAIDDSKYAIPVEFEVNKLGKSEKCSFANCFNFTKCLDTNLRIYIYPDLPYSPQSKIYSDILTVLRKSVYFTEDASEACLFILSVDTVDRDRISYSSNDLGFNPGKAMIAWTSSSRQHFRTDFDISIPLFHKEHPLLSNEKVGQNSTEVQHHDKYLASFKGKRYVYGIGSETRDILHYLHNNNSVIIASTCRHNSDWKKYEDERCEEDNAQYDRWDYNQLMENSTFCLIPRGRRLGSFRFLESLKHSCIPVIFSDDWIYDYLSNIPKERILKMRHSTQLIYRKYFASVEKIVLTSIKQVFERIRRHVGLPSQQNWLCY
uniref:Exostosin GT47 domain-containing protein n=1 Tax=Meloidogyne javanica TaxID=6303 RepID=A0A915N9M8_MELJA